MADGADFIFDPVGAGDVSGDARDVSASSLVRDFDFLAFLDRVACFIDIS